MPVPHLPLELIESIASHRMYASRGPFPQSEGCVQHWCSLTPEYQREKQRDTNAREKRQREVLAAEASRKRARGERRGYIDMYTGGATTRRAAPPPVEQPLLAQHYEKEIAAATAQGNDGAVATLTEMQAHRNARQSGLQ